MRRDTEPRYSDADLEPLLAALAAVRDGDFRPARRPLSGDGAVGEAEVLLDAIRDQGRQLFSELSRVNREVGRAGRLGERLAPVGEGGWLTGVEAANATLDALTDLTGAMAGVVGAVAQGDLTARVDLTNGRTPPRGELLRMARSVNHMVDQLERFTTEVTQVAREVGTDGVLGGQARVRGMTGAWRDLTDNVNTMASNLTYQVRAIAQVTTAIAQGDLTKRITADAQGEILQLKDTINTLVDQLSTFADEVTRVAREVGTDGVLGGQAQVRGVSGVWKELTENVNGMANSLTAQVRNIAQVTTAVARGDLTKKIDVDARGEILELKSTINTLVDQLSAFADEVTRVAREVGTDGVLGGQAQVRGVLGVWKELTDNVNGMADSLTAQVRGIAEVTTAVAHGDLTRKIDVDARGEILELKSTINTMVDTLSAFSSEVTRVAREVGSEGKLGGKADVEGVSGTWKRLTESVNELAGNLTTQVRAIAEVTTAVARGDLTRSIDVIARGEVAELKDNVNLMVTTLRETTRAAEQQDWLKSNLARIGGLMQGHRDLLPLARLVMSELTPTVSAHYGAFYLAGNEGLRLVAGYGVQEEAGLAFAPGEGLVGQAFVEKRPILLSDTPPTYLRIRSGLGEAAPASVIVLPLLFEDEVLGAIELASFGGFTPAHRDFFDQFIETLGVTINAILANTRTEALLAESQRLTRELQERSDELQRGQAELRRSNAELEEKAALLAKQNRDIEIQNFQIEQTRRTMEERAEQLAMSDRVKSEFLTNMSHELRTPLNSMLVLAKLLTENPGGNLTPKQVEFATTIHDAGTDLLQLINDILDLSKVEAGKMELHPQWLPLAQITDYVTATFGPLARDKGLTFEVTVAEDLPEALLCDEQRLQQVLRNLLSNAVKFTADGGVRMDVMRAGSDELRDPELRVTDDVLAFRVTDTGIGISADKIDLIFEAFQQADGTTSRRYGGTGLGLSISRDIARLLHGEIQASSTVGEGSTFTFYLPAQFQDAEPAVPRPQPVRVLPPAPVSFEDFGAAGLPADPPAEQADTLLTDRTVLIVDDDVRNVFALTSVLEGYGIEVLYAEDGQAGIDLLQAHPEVSLVLMDVMMPGLDGYATTAAIRGMPQFAALPIIVITAKAMRGDREKSLAAGASDYVPKPVDVDHLVEIMRTWLKRSDHLNDGAPE